MTLAGEIAFITGASRGIGAAAAFALGSAGAHVAVTARRLADAENVAGEIAASGGRAVAFACDVADQRSVTAAVAEAGRLVGAPTVLVNNAGTIEPQGLLHETDADRWAANAMVNLVGAAAATRAVLPAMLAARRGIIINISAGAAHRPIRGWSAYCAAKAGLAMLARSVTEEYGAQGIRVFGFAPGAVDTDMQVAIRAARVNAIAEIPREKLFPTADVGRAIVFLCTPAAASFAGREIDLREATLREAIGLPPFVAN